MKKLLVTGANGLLGQNVVKQLANQNNYEVYATARGECRFNLPEGINYVQLDLTSEESLSKAFNDIQPDLVIHTAAMTNVDKCEQEKEECWKINVVATENIIKAVKSQDAYLVNVSTDFVFDGEDGPYVETDKPNPVSYYGESKLKGEELCEQYGIRYSTVRTIIVYGVVDNMSRSNLVLWTKKSLENKQDIKVINDQFRSPTWAGDLAWACIKLAELEKEGIYHISGETTKSIYEWVEEVVEYFDLDDQYISPVSSADLNQPAKRPPKTGFDISKAKQDLGFSPKTFKEGIAEMMYLIDNQS